MTEESNYWQRKLLRSKMSRRRLLIGAAGGTAALALAACAGGSQKKESAGTPQAEGTPKPGGQWESSIISDWTIDPQESNVGAALVSYHVYSHLFGNRLDTGETTMIAAQEMEQPDDITYVFKLRDNIHFHNTPDIAGKYPDAAGRLVTAEDVKYSIERFRDMPAGFKDYVLNRMDHVEVVDQFTVKIVNKKPFCWTLSPHALGNSITCPILSREVVEKEGGSLKNAAVGTGPFTLDYASQTQGIRLVRNPDYFISDEPFVDSERYSIINDFETGEAAFRSGQIMNIAANNAAQAEALNEISGTYQAKLPALRSAEWTVNIKNAPWNDERVVQAVHRAFDRDAMILSGEGGRSGEDPTQYALWPAAFPPGQEQWSISQDEIHKLTPSYDPAEAKALLSAAGYDGIDVSLKTVNLGPTMAIAQIMATQLNAVGIKATLEPTDYVSFVVKVMLQFDYEMSCQIGYPSYSPEQHMRQFLTSGGSGQGNIAEWSDPEVDALYDDISATMDLNQRRDKVQAFERLIMQKQPPIIYLYSPFTYVQYRDYVKGIIPGGGDAASYNFRIWLDK
jgi:peptide/nickel transport system substrate-binding protein